MNRVIIMGNVGGDPDFRQFENQSSVINFSVGVSESFKDSHGNRIKATEWFRCVGWNSTALFAKKFVRKGAKVLIEGKFKTRNYTDGKGIERSISELNIERLDLIDWPKDQKEESPW